MKLYFWGSPLVYTQGYTLGSPFPVPDGDAGCDTGWRDAHCPARCQELGRPPCPGSEARWESHSHPGSVLRAEALSDQIQSGLNNI